MAGPITRTFPYRVLDYLGINKNASNFITELDARLVATISADNVLTMDSNIVANGSLTITGGPQMLWYNDTPYWYRITSASAYLYGTFSAGQNIRGFLAMVGPTSSSRMMHRQIGEQIQVSTGHWPCFTSNDASVLVPPTGSIQFWSVEASGSPTLNYNVSGFQMS